MTDRRSQPRLRAMGLSTPYGEVTNISDAGLCVFRKGKLDLKVNDHVTLQISHEQEQLGLAARVARIDKTGLFRHEVGFEFVGVDEATLTKLWSLTDTACCEFAGPRCWVAA